MKENGRKVEQIKEEGKIVKQTKPIIKWRYWNEKKFENWHT